MNRRRFVSYLGLAGLTCLNMAVGSGYAMADDGPGGGPGGRGHPPGPGGAPPGPPGRGPGPGPGPAPGRGPGGPIPRSKRSSEVIFEKDPSAPGDTSVSSDDAFSARRRGEIVSLKSVLASVQDERPGEVIEVKLFKKSGSSVYRVKTIDDEGNVHTVHVDAKNGNVLGFLGIMRRSLGLNENTGGGR